MLLGPFFGGFVEGVTIVLELLSNLGLQWVI
jgi:hypothetical protein